MRLEDTAAPRLFETDHVDWTPDRLRQRIEETRRLIRRIDEQEVEDGDFLWIRRQLSDDLDRKERLLDEMGFTS